MTTAAVDPDQLALTERIRTTRDAIGASQAQVARAAGLTRAALASIETGRRRVSAIELHWLARTFDSTAEQFLGDAGASPDVTLLIDGLTPAQVSLLTTYAELLVWQHNQAKQRQEKV
ncbi:helix-turn-helix domain-containing protein [Amycolatopsis thailandensis]|uniref:helix-turn-helix domain-containing protein n=1 Tax=Amycolatopsis thailandensis TaxID=589330 RepID=UPI003635D1FE